MKAGGKTGLGAFAGAEARISTTARGVLWFVELTNRPPLTFQIVLCGRFYSVPTSEPLGAERRSSLCSINQPSAPVHRLGLLSWRHRGAYDPLCYELSPRSQAVSFPSVFPPPPGEERTLDEH